MGHKGNYYRCSRPVLLAPADIPLVEYHSSGGGGDGQPQVSLMNGKALIVNKKGILNLIISNGALRFNIKLHIF